MAVESGGTLIFGKGEIMEKAKKAGVVHLRFKLMRAVLKSDL
jgi:hypothetical protein